MDKQNTPEITGQAADGVTEPSDVAPAADASEDAGAAEPTENAEAPQAPETSEAPAPVETADAPTYETRTVDPNLRSKADGSLVTSVDGVEVVLTPDGVAAATEGE